MTPTLKLIRPKWMLIDGFRERVRKKKKRGLAIMIAF